MLDYIVILAALLLPDLYEPQALVKVRREIYRVRSFLSRGDYSSAKMALCDMVFYTALAYHNRLISRLEAMEKIMCVANSVGLSILEALDLTETTYLMRVRTRNMIDLEAE